MPRSDRVNSLRGVAQSATAPMQNCLDFGQSSRPHGPIYHDQRRRER